MFFKMFEERGPQGYLQNRRYYYCYFILFYYYFFFAFCRRARNMRRAQSERESRATDVQPANPPTYETSNSPRARLKSLKAPVLKASHRVQPGAYQPSSARNDSLLAQATRFVLNVASSARSENHACSHFHTRASTDLYFLLRFFQLSVALRSLRGGA